LQQLVKLNITVILGFPVIYEFQFALTWAKKSFTVLLKRFASWKSFYPNRNNMLNVFARTLIWMTRMRSLPKINPLCKIAGRLAV